MALDYYGIILYTGICLWGSNTVTKFAEYLSGETPIVVRDARPQGLWSNWS